MPNAAVASGTEQSNRKVISRIDLRYIRRKSGIYARGRMRNPSNAAVAFPCDFTNMNAEIQ